jgi:hypothetical protein
MSDDYEDAGPLELGREPLLCGRGGKVIVFQKGKGVRSFLVPTTNRVK